MSFRIYRSMQPMGWTLALLLSGCSGNVNSPDDSTGGTSAKAGATSVAGSSTGGATAVGGAASGGAGGSIVSSGGAITSGGASGSTASGGSAGSSVAGTSSGGGTGTPSMGCGTPPIIDPSTAPNPGWPYVDDDRTRLTVASALREFSIYIPPAYDQNHKYALIFTFHGCGGGKSPSGFIDTAGTEAIIIAPQGLNSCGGQTGWDRSKDSMDFQFFDAMIDWAETGFCIDTDRIYASGHSHGGYFTGQLGCWRGDVLRGIAPLSGGPADFTECESQVSSIGIHHVMDGSVNIAEGEALRDQYATANHCTATQDPLTQSPCFQFTGCDAGYPVGFCPLTGDIYWDYGMMNVDAHNAPWAWAPAYDTMWSFWTSVGPK